MEKNSTHFCTFFLKKEGKKKEVVFNSKVYINCHQLFKTKIKLPQLCLLSHRKTKQKIATSAEYPSAVQEIIRHSHGFRCSSFFYLPQTFSILTQKLHPSRNEGKGEAVTIEVHEFPWHAVTY